MHRFFFHPQMSSRRLRARKTYEEDEERLARLFGEVSSDEEEQDPYADTDGEFASDVNYEPENLSLSDSSNTSQDLDAFLGLSSPPSTINEAVISREPLVELSPNTISANLPSTSHSRQSPRRSLFSRLAEIPAAVEQNRSSPTIFDQGNERSLIALDTLDREASFSAPNQHSDVPDVAPQADTDSVNVAPQLEPPSVEPQIQQQHAPNDWYEDTAPIPIFPFDDSNTGCTFPVSESSKPVDIFKHFLTDDMLQDICNRINAYGKNLCAQNRPHTRNARRKVFHDVTVKELSDFLALSILLGNLKTPIMRKAFTLKDPLSYHPIFPAIMSNRRFEQILRCFNVADVGAQKYEKVRLFIEQVITIFQSNFKPGKQLSLDESLLMFRGRLVFRVYMKSKKSRYGIKLYVLTTAEGYILNFVVYTGRDTDNDGNIDTKKVDRIVMKLMQPYLMKGHELYMDNFYNSIELSKKLLQHRTHTIGTLRKNRKGNPAILSQKLKKDEYVWRRNGQVYVSCWRDKRDVNMITTKHHPRLILSRNRHNHFRNKPVEVDEYNRYMSGIDRSDQMMSYYSCPRRTVRWYKKVIFHVLDMMLWNSFHIYKKHCVPQARFLNFRDDIVKSLLGIGPEIEGKDLVSYRRVHDNRRRPGVTVNVAPAPAPNSDHWPVKIDVPPGYKRKSIFRKCRNCTKNKLRHETNYMCSGCPGQPPLCPECFREWHIQEQTDI